MLIHELKSEGIVEVAPSLYLLNHFINRSWETTFQQQSLGVFSIQGNPQHFEGGHGRSFNLWRKNRTGQIY